MKKLINELTQYLLENLGIRVTVGAWDGIGRLPLFLKELYDFYETSVFERPYILAIATDAQEQSPASISKQLYKVRELARKDVVYVRRNLTVWNRKRLIERKISFIVPGNQLYLPLLGLDLREYVHVPSPVKMKPLSPSTQYLTLHLFYRYDRDMWTASELGETLKLKPMTITRALDELQSLSLFTIEKTGKTRKISVSGERREIWNRIEPRLRSPVMKKQLVLNKDVPEEAVLAGLSALSSRTMLAAPGLPEFAMHSLNWNQLVKEKVINILPVPDQDAVGIEVWRYSPKHLGDGVNADPLSVYLSLRNPDDERIKIALDELLGGIIW